MYFKIHNSKTVILCLYVDDILIFGSSTEIIVETKQFLSEHFDIKGLGVTNIILGKCYWADFIAG